MKIHPLIPTVVGAACLATTEAAAGCTFDCDPGEPPYNAATEWCWDVYSNCWDVWSPPVFGSEGEHHWQIVSKSTGQTVATPVVEWYCYFC